MEPIECGFHVKCGKPLTCNDTNTLVEELGRGSAKCSVRALTTKPENWSLELRIRIVEGENQLPQVVL